ncbi:MAG TPA: glycosyltransferase family 2 protein [Polyangiaceae bacterium]|nr:glycosyltransferase family 2 protein [Polyangiaceae bacterium]
MPDSSMSDPLSPPSVELSIIMPCLNEKQTLKTCIDMAAGFLERSGVSGEILIGDNGSTDGSQEIARKAGARVVDVPVRGYGAALYHATMAAHGRYAVMGDSDASYDFSDLMPFLKRLREGDDLVMGNRFAGGIKPRAMPWKNRYIGNPILSGIGRLLFRTPIRDFHCGIRGYSLAAFKALDLRTTGMEFASEMVIKATLAKMRVTEVPTTLSPDGRDRPPHLRPWRDGWRHLRFMLLYSPNWLFLYPGIALMLVGAALTARLLIGPWHVGGVDLDVHTLLYASFAIFVGFQITLFGIFYKVLGHADGLLPESRRLSRFYKFAKLELGVVVGVLFLLAGLVGSAFAVHTWAAAGFGQLLPGQLVRLISVSALGVALGLEVILGSFFLSLLSMRSRRPG